jgi:hypothetical protein
MLAQVFNVALDLRLAEAVGVFAHGDAPLHRLLHKSTPRFTAPRITLFVHDHVPEDRHLRPAVPVVVEGRAGEASVVVMSRAYCRKFLPVSSDR